MCQRPPYKRHLLAQRQSRALLREWSALTLGPSWTPNKQVCTSRGSALSAPVSVLWHNYLLIDRSAVTHAIGCLADALAKV
jgi:hypothetical protein